MRKRNICLILLFGSLGFTLAQASEPESALLSLNTIGEKAEHTFEAIYDGHSGKSLKSTWSIQRYLNRLEGELDDSQLNHMHSTLGALQHALSNSDTHAALLASNQLTLLSAEASREYRPDMPVEVTLLDYDGRQMQLWALDGDMGELKNAAKELRHTWNALLPDLRKHHAEKEIEAFSVLVDRANRSAAVSDYAALAPRLLEAVDDIEKVYGH